MASIILEGLRKVYPGKPPVVALEGLDLTIDDGELVAFVGPSGCGKSTVLRCVAGLEKLSAGRVIIGDREVHELPPGKRDIAMVFQSYALYPHLTVYKNLAFPLKERRVPRARLDAEVRRVAEMLELTPLLRRRPGQLSGGQRQRVAMGRALVREPLAFLLDEPLSNLDAKLRTQMRTEIAAVHRRLGITSIYVTHDQVEAMTLGQRIVVMRDGRLQQAGRPSEVYENPANLFVVGFLGTPSMNLLAGRIDRGILSAGPLRFGAPGAPDGEVVVGIRPEGLSPAGSDEGPVGLEVVVSHVEALGNENLIHAWVAAAGEAREQLVFRAPPRVMPRSDDRLRVRVDPAAVLVFDRVSESRVTLSGPVLPIDADRVAEEAVPEPYDLVVLGDANPDVILRGAPETLTFGQAEREVSSARLTLGGSGALVAHGAARMGLRTAFVGRVGCDPAADLVLGMLSDAGVDTTGVSRDADVDTALTVVFLRPDGDRAMLTAAGALSTFGPEHIDTAVLTRADHVHVASVFLQPRLAAALPRLLAIAREAGAVTSVDTNDDPSGRWDLSLDTLLPQVDYLLPNEREVVALAFGPSSRDRALAAARALAAHGPRVVVKCGAAGAFAVDNDQPGGVRRGTIDVSAGEMPGVVDTVGAGDTFDAGLIAGLAQGLVFEDALRLAVAAGTQSVRRAGGATGQPTAEEAAACPAGRVVVHEE